MERGGRCSCLAIDASSQISFWFVFPEEENQLYRVQHGFRSNVLLGVLVSLSNFLLFFERWAMYSIGFALGFFAPLLSMKPAHPVFSVCRHISWPLLVFPSCDTWNLVSTFDSSHSRIYELCSEVGRNRAAFYISLSISNGTSNVQQRLRVLRATVFSTVAACDSTSLERRATFFVSDPCIHCLVTRIRQ